MASPLRSLKRGANRALLKLFGLELRRPAAAQPAPSAAADQRAEGFPGYLAQATEAGLDVNDWIEHKLGWAKALPILEQTVFPYLREDAVVVELGSGTGRHARHIAPRLPAGKLHLVDHSRWTVDFLTRYFADRPAVTATQNDGTTLPFQNSAWADLVFANGIFIELKLPLFYLYSREFHRVLKPGGRCVFDYIDPTTPEGWKHLEAFSAQLGHVYDHHAPHVVDKVFASAGFEIEKRLQMGKSTYVVARAAGRT